MRQGILPVMDNVYGELTFSNKYFSPLASSISSSAINIRMVHLILFPGRQPGHPFCIILYF